MLLRMNTIDECCSMPPLAKGIVDDVAVSRVADWIMGMDADSCADPGFLWGSGTRDHGDHTTRRHAGHVAASNIVVNEDATYTNTTGAPLT